MTIEEIQAIPADEKGIITIQMDGRERKFVKKKLIAFLISNAGTILFDIPKRKKERPLRQKWEKKEKLPKGPDKRGHSNKVPIVAIMPDGKEIPFPSSMDAVKTLKVNKSAVSKVLTGMQQHVQNIRFKFQKTA